MSALSPMTARTYTAAGPVERGALVRLNPDRTALPRIRRQHGFWCVFRTPDSPRPVIIGHEFARVCNGARRMFPKRSAMSATPSKQHRGDSAETSPVPKNP